MRKRFYLMLLIVSLTVLGFLTPVQADEGAPAVFFEETSFHFGTVLEDINVTHDFKIQNKGDADLEIVDIKTG